LIFKILSFLFRSNNLNFILVWYNKKMEKFIKKLEFDEAAIQLFEALEKENSKIKNLLIESFEKTYNGLPVSPETEEEIYNYFITHSVISAATASNCGGSVVTEFLYNGLDSPSSIDNYFLQSKAGKAVKARLIAIEKELPKIIEQYRNNGNVLICNLGSGPGRDIIDTLATHYQNASNIKVINIDKDEVALKRGKRMAKNKGVEHLIDFVGVNFLKYKPNKKFDIILLIGVLCPLEIEVCIDFLKMIKNLLTKNGCLITSNASKKMFREDFFTYYIMLLIGNWKLVFKDEEEIKQIYKKAGYIFKKYFTDTYGFHIISTGTPFFET